MHFAAVRRLEASMADPGPLLMSLWRVQLRNGKKHHTAKQSLKYPVLLKQSVGSRCTLLDPAGAYMALSVF